VQRNSLAGWPPVDALLVPPTCAGRQSGGGSAHRNIVWPTCDCPRAAPPAGIGRAWGFSGRAAQPTLLVTRPPGTCQLRFLWVRGRGATDRRGAHATSGASITPSSSGGARLRHRRRRRRQSRFPVLPVSFAGAAAMSGRERPCLRPPLRPRLRPLWRS